MQTKEKPELKLVGRDGNAFAIIGAARRAGKRAGWTNDEVEAFTKEATSGDYDHVLQTSMKHFDVC